MNFEYLDQKLSTLQNQWKYSHNAGQDILVVRSFNVGLEVVKNFSEIDPDGPTDNATQYIALGQAFDAIEDLRLRNAFLTGLRHGVEERESADNHDPRLVVPDAFQRAESVKLRMR